MKKIFAVILTLTLSLSSVFPVFASGKISSNVPMTTTTTKHDEEVRKYLKDMKCPEHIRIYSVNFSDNVYGDISYRFQFDDMLDKISKEKDKTGNYRYLIYTESLIWVDDIHEEYAISRSGCYSEEGVTNVGNIVTFYPGMFPEGHVYENKFYFFSDGCKEYTDKFGYKNYGFDMSKHYVNVQLRYVVLDTLTGDIYYSQFSNPIKFGKGYEEEIDDPIEEFKAKPECSAYVKKYNLDYETSRVYPYYKFKFKESKEIRDASYNNAGETFLKVEVKSKDNKFIDAAMISYEFVNPSSFVSIYLPGELDAFGDLYDYNKLEFRIRYEYYLNDSDPDNSAPYAVGPWTKLTIN